MNIRDKVDAKRFEKILTSKAALFRYLINAKKHLIEGNVEWVWPNEDVFDASCQTIEKAIEEQFEAQS